MKFIYTADLCVDSHIDCPIWAANGQCDSWDTVQHCSWSCKYCGKNWFHVVSRNAQYKDVIRIKIENTKCMFSKELLFQSITYSSLSPVMVNITGYYVCKCGELIRSMCLSNLPHRPQDFVTIQLVILWNGM